jgi:hypothetical protein
MMMMISGGRRRRGSRLGPSARRIGAGPRRGQRGPASFPSVAAGVDKAQCFSNVHRIHSAFEQQVYNVVLTETRAEIKL